MSKLSIGLALSISAASPAFAVECNTFPNNTITGFVNDDVYAHGYTCTVARTGIVNANMYQSGSGDLVIRGEVNGGIEEWGAGSISLFSGAKVNGQVSEFDGGNVLVRGGVTLGGDVHEHDAGSLTVSVDRSGTVNGNLYESGRGSVFVRTITGSYNGSVFETGAGDIDVTVAAGTVFNGNIEEEDLGHVRVYVDGRFEGNLTELGDGNLSTAGNGTVQGNSEHELPGTCSNTVENFEGAICNLL